MDEGGSAALAPAHLKASDVDTALPELVVHLISAPRFGYVENDLPSPGFEQRNTGVSISKMILQTTATAEREQMEPSRHEN